MALSRLFINLYYLGEVNHVAEGFSDSSRVGTKPVCRQLGHIVDSASQVQHEDSGVVRSSQADMKGDEQLGFWVNRCPSPGIADPEIAVLGFLDVLCLAMNERPNLVTLDGSGLQAAYMLIVEGYAGFTQGFEEP